VYERAKRCSSLSEVVVATCDHEIRKAVEGRGGKVIMTSDKHERGTDRVAEAAERMSADVIINIQGDEPLLDPRMLKEVSAPLVKNPKLLTCNLIQRLEKDAQRSDSNLVKVVFTKQKRALYFSREPIPTRRYVSEQPAFRQLGVIAFTKSFLNVFKKLKPTTLEKAESVDMMRVLENGYPITLVETSFPVYSVDTPPELDIVETLMRKDALAKTYLNQK
jgi:3-deoxy-manno-octulosonate cytidylyltransferase (CMP-KDO synthetase)